MQTHYTPIAMVDPPIVKERSGLPNSCSEIPMKQAQECVLPIPEPLDTTGISYAILVLKSKASTTKLNIDDQSVLVDKAYKAAKFHGELHHKYAEELIGIKASIEQLEKLL